jgi:flagellar motor component MotA
MKLSIVIVLASTFISLLGLVAFLIYSGNDVSTLMNALPAIVVALGTLFGVSVVNKKVDVVRGQTNGTLSAMRSENLAQSARIVELLEVATPEQIEKIRAKSSYGA